MSKVLIVEDQQAMAAMVRHHMENAGYDVLTASGVDAAWDLLVSEPCAAAIVDIELPGKDGWDLLTRSRIDERTRNMPMVVLTGLHGKDIRAKAEALGAEYFTKPFAASALVNRMNFLVHGPVAVEPIVPEIEIAETFDEPTRSPHSPLPGIRELPAFLEEEVITSMPPPPELPVERIEVPEVPPLGSSDAPLDLVAVKVVLLLGDYQVEGSVHMPPDAGRFSDAWESMFLSPRSFVPVTDAKVIVQGGPRAVAATEFLQIRKSDIKGIFPTEM